MENDFISYEAHCKIHLHMQVCIITIYITIAMDGLYIIQSRKLTYFCIHHMKTSSVQAVDVVLAIKEHHETFSI